MTKIDIISGFLGAGKTTLIKKLLQEAFSGEKVVLIENEFGEIGIDGGFLKEAGVQITEMNSGCICCSLVGDFGTALKEVLDTYSPDRIIIEPSGVGKLSDVIAAVERVAQEGASLALNSFVTVVDAMKCKIYMKNFGEFFNNQVEHASAILLSRTQSVDEGKLHAAVDLLRQHNAKAAILTTPWDQLTGAQIVAAMEGGHSLAEELMHEIEHHRHHHHHDHDEHCDCGCHDHEHEHHHHHEHDHEHGETCSCGHHHEHGHHHHHADEVFVSIGWETAKRYEQADIAAMLEKLSDEEEYGHVLRAKGILCNAAGEWFQFDYVPGESQFRAGSPDYTGRICIIGAHIDEKALKALMG